MSRIVLGLATSHTPLLALASEEWRHRAAGDRNNQRLTLSNGRIVSYDELLRETGPIYAQEVVPEALAHRAAQCQVALERLADALESARPDVVVIIGDDQRELFGSDNQPAIAIHHGSELVMLNRGSQLRPDWMGPVYKQYLMDDNHKVPGEPVFGRHLIEGLTDFGVDVCASDKVRDPSTAGFGHAIGFVVKRLFRDRSIPVVPVLLNTYFPPNVPSAARCYDVGRSLRKVIDTYERDVRVALVASGGLSHFVVDEALDRSVIGAIEDCRPDILRQLPRCSMVSGSSEILNWVMAAGVMSGHRVQSAEYYPLRRTEAGTGVGAGFVVWGELNPT